MRDSFIGDFGCMLMHHNYSSFYFSLSSTSSLVVISFQFLCCLSVSFSERFKIFLDSDRFHMRRGSDEPEATDIVTEMSSQPMVHPHGHAEHQHIQEVAALPGDLHIPLMAKAIRC